MKHVITIGILIIVLWSCKHIDKNDAKEIIEPINQVESIDTLQTLVGTNWNIIINETDSNLFKYNNQPLFFSGDFGYFFDQRIGKFAFISDTIILRDSSYISSLNPEYDMKLSLRTYLIGTIEKITKDSLTIKKIYGSGRPFHFNAYYKFYNDTLLYNPNVKLNRIVYSTSTCYGECPAMAIEIGSNGNYKFFGGSYSEYQGNYIGTIGDDYIREIEDALRRANIEKQPDRFPIAIDVPNSEMIIYYNDSLRKAITGHYGDLPPRLSKVASLVYNSYKSALMDSVGEKLNFETMVHLPVPPPPSWPVY